MAAPKPKAILRHSARMKEVLGVLSGATSADDYATLRSKCSASDVAVGNDDNIQSIKEGDHRYPTSPSQQPEPCLVGDETPHPSFASFINKADDQLTYTKFYSSLDEAPELQDPLDFVVPEGFGLEYHGCLSSSVCEKALLSDGEYLVRMSSSKRNSEQLTLSLR